MDEYQRLAENKAFRELELEDDRLSGAEAEFIQARDSFYMSTVGENGWPYVQYRGGPKGFLKVLDETTLAYADFRGNGQYISTGNIKAGNRAALILMDYANRKRLKIWTEVSITQAQENAALLKQLEMPEYSARVERLVVLNIQAYDWNCPQHITPRYTLDEIRGWAKLTGDEQWTLIAELEQRQASRRDNKAGL